MRVQQPQDPASGSVVMNGVLPCSSRVADPPRPAREELAVSVRPLGCVMGAEPVAALCRDGLTRIRMPFASSPGSTVFALEFLELNS